MLIDDAAITLRYAWRIGHGYGFTYNDGDPTNGASAPLYTLLLAALGRTGLDLEDAAKVIGALCYAAGCGLVSWLGARIAGPLAAILAPTFLILNAGYRQLMLSGMESGLAVVLGLLALYFLASDREVLAGAFIGLAVVNKLDAGALAAAIALAYLVVERRPPTRIAGVAMVTALPWFAFSTAYFGSPIPYSAVQKATEVHNVAHEHDPLWMLRELLVSYTGILCAAAGAAVLLIPRLASKDRRAASVLFAAMTWGLIHLGFFSLVNLGDPYPWYRTILYPPICLGAAVVCAHVVRTDPVLPAVRRWTAPAVGLLALLVGVQLAQVPAAVRVAVRGHEIDAYEAFDGTRREAGAVLASVIEPGQVVQTCFGWPAYMVPTSPIDEVCPLSTRRPVGPPDWGVISDAPGEASEPIPAGASVFATISSDAEPEGRSRVLRFDGTEPG